MMSFPKLLAIAAAFLFGIIGIAAFFKGDKQSSPIEGKSAVSFEVELNKEIRPIAPPPPPPPSTNRIQEPAPTPLPIAKINNPEKIQKPLTSSSEKKSSISSDKALPEANRIEELFNTAEPKLAIVETITYKSRVPWQKGRPAWISDYASHYTTSRHFIARSLNGKPEYFKQDVAEGDRFNVLNSAKNISFYLLIDTTRSKLWFYYLDLDTNERVLLKTYPVGLGRLDTTKPSGMLTPLGKYSLGSKIAIYKPKVLGTYNGQKVEMIRIFGTRWIPFDQEISGCTAPANGFGIHGVPWTLNDKGELIESLNSLGKYESDGCIRLATADIEELFAIIITRPATIELVKDFYDAKLPGMEKADP